ncbi:hypothetical protein F511_28517 [Dorcoceras hygrometricum]|uniref:Helicase domain-containing family protein n=1 Tax=Dorcoceras hygrometricum TaxID=472368 RepID=A0A2Z7C4Q7_9LAMI|nr:hypothetical protein F511_28517 [Dorcoceras hygrometricum]
MSLFDLQDVCIAIGSIATLDLPMVVDLIGIYGLKGPYCTLTTTNWFLQALSVIPRGSWGDVARRTYHDPMGKSGIMIPEPQWGLERAKEISGLACKNSRATLLLRDPSHTSTQASQLVSIERATQDELIATGLTPNNGGNRRQTGEGFE